MVFNRFMGNGAPPHEKPGVRPIRESRPRSVDRLRFRMGITADLCRDGKVQPLLIGKVQAASLRRPDLANFSYCKKTGKDVESRKESCSGPRMECVVCFRFRMLAVPPDGTGTHTTTSKWRVAICSYSMCLRLRKHHSHPKRPRMKKNVKK
ncbi:MAG: hypothetical protein KatS3mg105_3993 [Gemmatales bacterium]|nr:MAG: hypothetical protein KatS3mg105_3993 [Gemmatales bacterium]